MIKEKIRGFLRNRKRNHVFSKLIPNRCKDCELLGLCQDLENQGKCFDRCIIEKATEERAIKQALETPAQDDIIRGIIGHLEKYPKKKRGLK